MFQFPPLPPALPHHRLWLFGFVFVFAALEIAFQLSDARVIAPGLRGYMYREFAFFDPWFDDWVAGRRTPPQVTWMPLSYAFLHGSMTHLLMNSAAFLGLGLVVLRIFGAPLFLLFFAVTAIGGALVYGAMAEADFPMVGASGVVFGFIGVLKYAEWAFIRRQGGDARQYLGSLAGLALINVLLSVALAGIMAWQTHLGGFVFGWLAAWWVVPRA